MNILSERIEAMIAAGNLLSGDRLPPERQLAADLGVSRSSLREAIKQLVSRGLLVSHQGGGTYVTSPEEAEPVRAALLSIAPLAKSEAGYWRDVMELRKSLEGDAAAFAALRAEAEDKTRISAAYDVLTEALAAGLPELAILDAGFHMAVARAAHNAVLYQIMTGLEGLLETSISDSLASLYQFPGVPEELDRQHRRILEAVIAGDPSEARGAATDHLIFVESCLESVEQEAARRKRFAHALRQVNT